MMDGENMGGVGDMMALAQNRVPDRNYVLFYKDKVRLNFKSEQEGRDIYEDRDFVLIITPGQNKDEMRREATNLDKQNYANQWRAYQEKREQLMTGTPIDLVPGIGPSLVAQLKTMNVFTAEQMAELAEARLGGLGMEARKIQNLCKAFIEKSNPEILELKAKNQALETQIAELKAAVEALQVGQKPPKQKTAKPAVIEDDSAPL